MFSEKSFPDGKVRMPVIGKFDKTRTTLLPQWIDLVVTLVKEGWAVELGDWKFEIGNCRATASARGRIGQLRCQSWQESGRWVDLTRLAWGMMHDVKINSARLTISHSLVINPGVRVGGILSQSMSDGELVVHVILSIREVTVVTTFGFEFKTPKRGFIDCI